MNTSADFVSLLAAPENVLRVAFLLPDEQAPEWARRTMDSVEALGWVKVAGVFARSEVRSTLPTGWDRYLHLCHDVATPLRKRAISTRPFSPDAVADLDVLICLGDCRIEGEKLGWTRDGVWSFHCDAPDRESREPLFFRQVQDREEVSTLSLVCHQASWDRGRCLRRLDAPTDFSLYFTRNAATVLEAAPRLLRSSLYALATKGGESYRALPEISVAPHNRDYPGTGALSSFAAKQLWRSLQLRIRPPKPTQWFVALRRTEGSAALPLSTQGFLRLPNPTGGGMADPFLVERDGQVYLFVEEILPGGRGRLAVGRITREGTLEEFRPVLDRPFHLSYPHVFRHAGEFFMIPESSADLSVTLYRARKFPDDWSPELELFRGVALVDSTPWFDGERWYLFTTASSAPETYLFTAPELHGPWRPHPVNPISSDVRCARGAGPLFRDAAGRLIRPAQDSSVRYGRALVFQEIKELSGRTYAEATLQRIRPEWSPGLICTHHFATLAGWQVIDGRGPIV